MEPPTYLANKYPHERDSHIHFDEGPHIYTIDGDSDYMSVTTWNHSHFAHFDPDAIIEKMMNGLHDLLINRLPDETCNISSGIF